MDCLLHIGTEKTATTTIQNFLRRNRRKLAANGVAMSDVIGKPNNRRLSTYFSKKIDDYLRDQNISTEEEKQRHFVGLLDSFREEVAGFRAKGLHSFVISSEHFHSRLVDVDDILAFRNFLDPLFDRMTVVCYLREQSALAKSRYSTSVRNGSTASFSSFLKQVTLGNAYYNYVTFLDKWAAVFGRENLRPAIFPPPEDIRADFMRHLPDANHAEFDFEGDNLNRQLSPLQVEIIRCLNEVMPRTVDGVFDRRRSEIVKFISNHRELAAGHMVNRHANEIYRLFDESNKTFAETYLGERRNPFAEPDSAGVHGEGGLEFTDETRALISLFVDYARSNTP